MDPAQRPIRRPSRTASGESETSLPRRHSLTTSAHHDVVVRGEQTRLPLGPDSRERRALVIHRLLARGLSPRTLRALLPDWDELIAAVAGERDLASTPRR